MSKIIDFHTHILPGMDDGSHCVQESLALLHEEARQGITCVVASPHFYASEDSLDSFLKRRDEALHHLLSETDKLDSQIGICAGAEVSFYHGMSESEQLRSLCISGTASILIEMPNAPWSNQMYKELSSIYDKQGLIPIVAHVDRYISKFRNYCIPERLAQLPVFVQANASFFIRRSTSGMALAMLKKNQIHVLGSDCHNMKDRAPNMESAVHIIGKKLGAGAIDTIIKNQRVIFGE